MVLPVESQSLKVLPELFSCCVATGVVLPRFTIPTVGVARWAAEDDYLLLSSRTLPPFTAHTSSTGTCHKSASSSWLNTMTCAGARVTRVVRLADRLYRVLKADCY
jgi:hypothetical protein